MKFLRAVNGCTLRDHLQNIGIRKHLKLKWVLDRIQEYKQNCKSYVKLMVDMRIPRFNIAQKEREIVEDPRKNCQILCENGTGYCPSHLLEKLRQFLLHYYFFN